MAATASKTDEVLASARKELEAQLAVVREELSRITAEERMLTQALASLDGDSRSAQTDGSTSNRAERSRTARSRSSSRKTASGRTRRRGASKSTAERVDQLRGLLAEGPRSRTDLAAALKVSPGRVQQLLAELGSSVSSQPDPNQRRGKLWVLAGSGDGAGGEVSARRRRSGRAKGTSTRKPRARRKQSAR